MPSVPAISPVLTPTGVGVSLATYRHRLADQLGFCQVTSTSSLPSGGDPTRLIQANELRDDELGYDLYPRAWVYVASSDQAGSQRRILNPNEAGYQGELGALVVSRPFAGIVPSGSTIEVTSPLPVKRHLGVMGLNDMVQQGLERIKVKVRAAIVGNDTYSYDLATLPTIRSMDDTYGIYDTLWSPTTVPAMKSPYGYRIVENGVDRTLITDQGYTSSETFYLEFSIWADRLVYDGSSWAYTVNDATTPALQNDTYQASAPVDWVVTFGMVKALQHVNRLIRHDAQMDKQEKAEALAENFRDRQRWAVAALQVKQLHFPDPEPMAQKPMIEASEAPAWA